MADFFNSRPGIVAVITAPNAVPGRIRLGDFDPKAALISGIDYVQRTNQQFQYSLDKAIYIYVFGDLMGTLRVKGLAFPQLCPGTSLAAGGADGQSQEEGDSTQTGIGEILAFYRDKRAAVQADPVTVTIGKDIISGFLTEMGLVALTTGYDPSALAEEFTLGISTSPQLTQVQAEGAA